MTSLRAAIGLVLLAAAAGAAAATPRPNEQRPPCPVLPDVPCAALASGEVRCGATGGDEVATFPGFTAYCNSCHEALFRRASASPGKGHASHPVDVIHPVAGTDGLRPAPEVEPRVPLEKGRITCRTCHAGKDAATFHLSIGPGGTALCLACHRK